MPPTEQDIALAGLRQQRRPFFTVRAWRSTSQTIAAGAVVGVSFDKSEAGIGLTEYDYGGMHDPISDPTKFYAKVRGVYRYDLENHLTAAPNVSQSVRLNGAGDIQYTTSKDFTVTNAEMLLSSGDYLELMIDDTGGVGRTVNTLARIYPVFQLRLLHALE